MPQKIVKSTQSKLNSIASKGNAVRVGFTVNPSRRAAEYARAGIPGVMHVAPTTSGKKAEQRLLNNQFTGSHSHKNVQQTSNITSGKKGYVYSHVKK